MRSHLLVVRSRRRALSRRAGVVVATVEPVEAVAAGGAATSVGTTTDRYRRILHQQTGTLPKAGTSQRSHL